MSNISLRNAQKAKNDEFYTQYEDIAKEIQYYTDLLKDKIIYCNCDSLESNFVKFFKDNYHILGIKKLIATYKNPCNLHEKINKIEYVGEEYIFTPLEGDGGFESPECIEILKEADIVITNCPFSLFRNYIALLIEHNKKFLIVGNKNAITYKNVFPLLKDGKIWLGRTNIKTFVLPDGSKKNFGNICWFTNLPHEREKETLVLTERYYDDNGNPLPGIEEKYPKYDNFDAINVNRLKDIPYDYEGVMGVPITFIEKYCSKDFEIKSINFIKPPQIISFRKGTDGKDLTYKELGGGNNLSIRQNPHQIQLEPEPLKIISGKNCSYSSLGGAKQIVYCRLLMKLNIK